MRTARLSTVQICLVAALLPLTPMRAQVTGQPGGRQRAVPDLVALVLYIPPISLGGGGPPPPPGPQGGREAEGSAILSGDAPAGGAVITLSSGNTALLHLPAMVTVPAGARSVKFRYDPLPVAEPTTVSASAVHSGQTRTASVLILPPNLQALTLDSLQIQGGKVTSGSVKLNGIGPTDKDIRVALSSNHPAVQVPAEVLLRGVQQKPFQVTTKAVGQPIAVVVSGLFAGRKLGVELTVVPSTLASFGQPPVGSNTTWNTNATCFPQGSGPISFTGKIPLAAKLTGPLPLDGGAAIITIASSNPQLLPVPATLSIAPNAIQSETQLTCPSPAAESIVTITGTYRGVSRTYLVTVRPLNTADLTVSAVLHDAAGNVITRPTNPLPFQLCATVAQSTAGTNPTNLLLAYQHSRGFSQQMEMTVWPQNPQACRMIEGLEIGEYVDVTLTVDPANTIAESNEQNNILKLRVTR